jgi:spermidine/putrescine ABC transporter ATP-binding subunit
MNHDTPQQTDVPSHSIQIRSASKRFGEFTAVDAVSLDIRRGEFFSLLGSSGCGKTTLLRMIAGFEQPTEGQILINGGDVTGTPPYRRPVNLVFQHFALFPHLTVAKNVAFGLKYQDVSTADRTRRVGEALELVRLAGLDRRYPNELSGGQKQRVALARALVLRPQVLLLDEPLGALDQKLRKEMQVELKNLQRALGITFVFVTHDQEEAMTMSDRIAVMNGGHVEQCDASSTVFEYPRTEFVAQFMGAANFLGGKVLSISGDEIHIVSPAGFETRVPARGRLVAANSAVRFMVRPEKLWIRREPGGETSMEAVVEQRVYQGLSTVWTVRNAAGEALTVYEQNTRPFNGSMADAGGKVYVCWDPGHAVLMDPSTI